MKHVLQWLLLTGALCASGCATGLVRTQPEKPPPGLYPATKLDCGCFIWGVGIRGSSSGSPEDAQRAGPLQRVMATLCGVLDLPFSLVTDTVFIPSDIRRIQQHKKRDVPIEQKSQDELTLEERRQLRDMRLREQTRSNQASEAIGAETAPQPQR